MENVKYSFRFSRAERTIYRKRKKIPVSDWMERHRFVMRGPMEGTKAKKLTVPYLPPVMDASFFPSVEETVLCFADQCGKSFVVDTCIFYAIDREPGPVLYIYPDRDTATENNRDRIHPAITKSPRLRSYLTGVADDETMTRINLQHMQIYMAWAHSAMRLANRSIKYLVFDETDKYPDVASLREADPIAKGEKRARTFRFHNRKMWKVSTPTIETGPIWEALNKCQVIFDYWVCCPDCDKTYLMEFEDIKWPKDERDSEKIENEDLAYFACPKCGAVWNDTKRNIAVRLGEWRARDGKNLEIKKYLKKHRPKKIGFHLPSWISRFVGLSEVAAAFLASQTSKNALKDFRNSHQALPWQDYALERKEDRVLMLRDDRPRGIVPSGDVISCLTAGVDTQGSDSRGGFWYEVRAWGWGQELESWQIRDGYIEGWTALMAILWEERYVDADDNEYYIRLAVQDAMGHRTSEVYDMSRKYPGRLIAFQGVDTRRMTQPHAWSNIEYYPGTKKPIPGGVRLLRADATYYKNILASKLAVNPEDPGAWHLHRDTDEEWARHLCAEYLNDKDLWECPDGRANHGWDCSYMNLVASDILRVKFWNRETPTADDKPKTNGKNSFIPKKKKWLER